MIKKPTFWLAVAILLAWVVTWAFELIHSDRLVAASGIAGGLAFLYLVRLTDKSVDAKFAAWWSAHYDKCDQEEVTELNEHLDDLVVACNENDGPEIARKRGFILEVVAEIQSDRRENRK